MTDFLITNQTPIILANVTDYAPTAAASITGTRTHQLNLTSLAAAAYRQGDKFDFGATRARQWYCRAAFEPVSVPAVTGAVEVFIGYSNDATAANDNEGNLSGVDGPYVGYGTVAADADEMITQLERIASVRPGADAVVQPGSGRIFIPKMRYGCVVVRNGWSVAFIADAVEMSVQLWPILDQTP